MASEISGRVAVVVLFNASTAVVCRDVRNEIGAGPCGEILPYIPLLEEEVEMSEREGRRVLHEVFVSTFGQQAVLRSIFPRGGALWWELRDRELLDGVTRKIWGICVPHLHSGTSKLPSLPAVYLGPSPDKFRTVTRCQDGNRMAEPALVRLDPETLAITEVLLKSPALVASVH